MKTFIVLFMAAALVGATVEAKPVAKQPVKVLKAKKPQRVVKRSANYRKTKADIDNEVEQALRGGSDQDSSNSEPAIDVSELEIDP